MFTKYANFEASEVLEVKGASTQARTASLDKLSDFHDYRTDDGYLYARIIAISSRVNKNNDGWPSKELAGGDDAWNEITAKLSKTGSVVIAADKERRYGFSTFMGKPIFVDHHNTDPKRARGVIVDAKLHVTDGKTSAMDPYYSSRDVDPEHLPPTRVELLLEVDAKSFPKLAQAIVEGSQDPDKGIDGFSMGCDVERSKCSHCGKIATSPQEYCSHIVSKGALHNFKEADGSERARKSYENCYGIKFFEISNVFDPADESALLQELIDEGAGRTAANYAADHPNLPMRDFNTPPIDPNASLALANSLAEQHGGSPADWLELAERKLKEEQGGQYLNDIIPKGTDTPPQTGIRSITWGPQDVQIPHGYEPRQGSFLASLRQADNPLPQFMHTTAPEAVDTLREEKVCPVCGEDMDGPKCAVCGHEDPPEGLDNPDLTMAQDAPKLDEASNMAENNLLEEKPQPGSADAMSYLQAQRANNSGQARQLTTKAAGTVRAVESPLKPANTPPATNEPKETVISDQTKPVTAAFRTAMDLIQAVKKTGENMANKNTTVAATPADPSGKAQKQVDVTGVGGVVDATNEQASKPTGPHRWEPAGTQTDVEGKGGIIEDSNAEASKPSAGSTDLPSGEQDNAGFQDGGQKGPKTQTFPNTNEPSSAVTDKAFPTAAVEAAKQGVKPTGGSDVQPQRREDLEQESGFTNPQTGTDQWTGTGGNGVTRQQDPVTQKVDPNIDVKSSSRHLFAAIRLADQEVEMGLLDKAKKYDRIAELEGLTPEELAAEDRVVSRVRTAGLTRSTRTASASGLGGRMPSFRKITGNVEEAPAKTASVSEEISDAALFIR